MKNILHIITMGTVTLLLLGCHHDHTDNVVNLPTCTSDERDTSVSITVPNDTTIKALTDDTNIRLWHYDNGDKLVCVINGEAIITGE